MKLRHVLTPLIVAAWLSGMGMALSLPFWPQRIIRMTEPIVCPPGTSIEVGTPRCSWHRPG